MNLKEKISAIFSHIENTSIANPIEAEQMKRQAVMKEREIFEKALIETIESGGMSYDEAVARVKASDFSNTDKNIILANISHLEAKLPVKTASSIEEVNNMDSISKDIAALKEKLPAYGAFVENVIKNSYFLGTGDKAKADPQGEKVFKDDENYVKQSILEEEKRMKQVEKKIDPENRTSPQSRTAGTEKHNTKPPQDLRESYAPNHAEWDNKVLEEELAAAQKGQKEQEKRTKELEKKREEYLRAAERVYVKFSNASNAWIIAEKGTDIPIVIASVEDITGNHPISKEALAELKSEKFGELIMQDIRENGLEVAARNLLGDTFDKLAAEHAATIKRAELKAEEKSKLATLKGIYVSLKENLKDLLKVSSVRNLFVKAKTAIEKAEDVLEKNEINPEIAEKEITDSISDAAEALSPISDIGLAMEGQSDKSEANKLAEEIKSAITDPNIKEKVDRLVSLVMDSDTSEGTTPLIETPAEEVDLESEKDKDLDLEQSEIPEISESEVSDENEMPKDLEKIEEVESEEDKGNKNKEEEKEEVKDNKKKDEKSKDKKVSSVSEALKKFGVSRQTEKLYDVTEGFSLDQMGEHNKGNITQDGKKFMTWESLKKQFESIVDKKPTGKLVAEFIGQVIKKATKDGILSAEEVYRLAFGPEYANQLTQTKTQEDIKKEHEKLTKDTKDAYASTDEAYINGAIRMKLAIEATQAMVKKGMIKEGDREAFDRQVENFMKMDEDTFRAFMDATENVVATTELEDGRFKVATLSEPDEYGNIVVGFIDGKHVASMNGEDIKSSNGKVSKAHLANALQLLKRAFKEGIFDEVLSDGKIETTAGETDLYGLNLGQDSKPVLRINDLL